ncbi:MAG TPA: galactose-6-phosphate isomerase subunit LacA [Alloiococcus sp.]|nr:galactose-6-phosphate isomerase subunit LacA [Alloiococcus sp.]
MKVILGSDLDGLRLKNVLKEYLQDDYEVIDVSPEGSKNFIESVSGIVEEMRKDDEAYGIAIDKIGAGSFMAASKHKGIVCAEISDERSAFMTREHNNAKMITIGSDIVADAMAKSIAHHFLSADYDGGRHQVRVDMLNELC